MTFRPYILAETPWKTVRETAYEVAILPWGATEAHNYHLPYATDNFQADYVAAEAARQAWGAGAKVVVLPCVPFGVNTGQLDIPLTLNLNPSTQAAILRDLVTALSGQRVCKLLILNGHGGNDFKPLIREILSLHAGFFLGTLNWYQVFDPGAYFDVPGDHAGELETSTMLHIVPHLVQPLEEAGDGRALAFKLRGLREGWAWTSRDWVKVTRDTGVGNPALATAEKGQRFLEAVTAKIADFLVELAACDLDDLYG